MPGFDGFLARLLSYMLLPPILVGLILLGALWRLWRTGARCTPAALLESALPSILRLLFVLYPLIANKAFEAFSCCSLDDGSSFLIADMDVSCHSDFYLTDVRVVAWVAIAVYAFGLWALNAGLLFFARRAILTEQPTTLSSATRFLYKEYESWAFWWECAPRRRERCAIISDAAQAGTRPMHTLRCPSDARLMHTLRCPSDAWLEPWAIHSLL